MCFVAFQKLTEVVKKLSLVSKNKSFQNEAAWFMKIGRSTD